MIPYRIFLTNFHLLISFQIKLIPLFLSPALTSSFFLLFYSFSFLAPQCGRPYNNGLYRSGLDPLSATNLCYTKLFLKQYFLFLFFLKRNYCLLSFKNQRFQYFVNNSKRQMSRTYRYLVSP